MIAQPCWAAHSKISSSGAVAAPTLDQCLASKPASSKQPTHSGLRFMSTNSVMPAVGPLPVLRLARRHSADRHPNLPIQDKDKPLECALGSGLPQTAVAHLPR